MIRPFRPIVLVFLAGWIASPVAGIAGEEKQPGKKPSYGGSRSADRGSEQEREFWDSLSEENKEKLRSALREVWTDPGVISAREEVKEASEAYHQAIRTAIAKADPSVADLLAKVQSASEGRVRDQIGAGPPGRFVQRRGGDYPMSPPGFFESLTEEERERFKTAQEQAQHSEPVRQAREQLDLLEKQDDELRRRRHEAHRRLRREILEQMVAADPKLKEIQERLEKQYGGPATGNPEKKAPDTPKDPGEGKQ